MKRLPIDDFLLVVRRIHWFVLLVQLALLSAGGWAAVAAARAVAEKYTWVFGLATGIALGTVLLILLIQTLVRSSQRTEFNLAQELDARFALKERLSTYVEIRRVHHPFLNALSADTRKHLRDVSPWKAANPARTVASCALVPAIMLALLFLIPYLPVPESIASGKHEQEQIRQEAQQLARKIETLQKKRELSPEMQKLLSHALKETKEMQKPGMGKSEALKRLNALENKLAQIQKQSRSEKQQQLAKSLQDAKTGEPGKSADTPSKDEIEQLTKDIQDALGSDAKDLQGSKEIATTNQQQPQMSRQQMDSMKKALEQYRRDAAETRQRMAEMQKALENARQGMAKGGHKVTADSRIKDRDIEKGGGGVEDGPGTTNKDVGPQHFSTKKQGTSEYAEDRTKVEYQQLYKGERTEAANDPLMLGSKWNDSGDVTTQHIRSFGLDSQATAARQGGDLAGQDSQESEIRKEKVPAAYQKMVKEYFESIQRDDD